MERNTVILDLDKYNELRDYQKEVVQAREQSRCAVILERHYDYGGYSYGRKYYTENEIVYDFEKRIKEVEALNKRLKDAIFDLEHKLYRVKLMNVFEFLKWKHKN